MESYITAIVANSNMYQINLIEWSNPRCVVQVETLHTVINKGRILVLHNTNEFSASS